MSWYCRFYHLPFWRIFQYAKLRYLPKRLLECQDKPPLCITCQFGQSHRRPWHTKLKKIYFIKQDKDKEADNDTSINQIVSAQPGLIPQMAGYLTSYIVWDCTNFCDHVSDCVYVHLMRNFTLAKTILANTAY